MFQARDKVTIVNKVWRQIIKAAMVGLGLHSPPHLECRDAGAQQEEPPAEALHHPAGRPPGGVQLSTDFREVLQCS